LLQAILAILLCQTAVLAEPGEPNGSDAARADDVERTSTDSATPGEPADETAPDLDEEVYVEDPDIEVIKVRGGESSGAADFEVGDSVAAFDESDLAALGAQNIADLAAFTPNLEIVTTGATTPTFFIRGVGLNVFNANSSGAVAILFNGVPKNSPALQLGTLFDVESVNVLRGPQGSGNYRGASGGAIKIYSKKPTGDYNAVLSQSYGNYNALDIQGAVGGPVYEDLVSGRIAFRISDRDGYGRNGCGDAPLPEDRMIRPSDGVSLSTDPLWSICGEDVPFEGATIQAGNGAVYDGRSLVPAGLDVKINNQHNWGVRASLLFEPTLDQEWLLIASGGKRDELSRQGQALGTNRDVKSILGPFGGFERGVLGSIDGGGYNSPEVDQQRWELDPCRDDKTGATTDSNGDYLCQLPGGEQDFNKIRFTNEVVRTVLARDIATSLDSDPYRGDYNAPGKTYQQSWGVSLQGDIVVAKSVGVKSVTGFDSYERSVAVDTDQSPNVSFESSTDDSGWQFVQMLELGDSLGDGSPIDWNAGGLFMYEELTVAGGGSFSGTQRVNGVSNRDYRQKLWSGGVFADFRFKFYENFVVDAGVRYNWDRKSMNYELVRAGTLDFDVFARDTWHAPSGTVRLTYNFKSKAYVYWKYTRGWKGAHYNATGGDDAVFAADPETIDSFEIGLHGTWLSGKVTADFALFHYNYQDYQLFTVQQRYSSFPEFVVINAPNSEIYGAELDIGIRPLPGMLLFARLAWLETQFLDYTQIQVERREFAFANSIIVNNEISNTGEPLLNSPRFKLSLTGQQTVPLGNSGTLTVRWDGAWTDDVRFDATQTRGIPNEFGDQFLPKNTIGQPAYWRHNLRVAYRTPNGQVEVAGWVRNLKDKVFKAYAFDVSSFNGTTVFFLGEPRTYGVSLQTAF